jgi:Tol biopolymer transport system component
MSSVVRRALVAPALIVSTALIVACAGTPPAASVAPTTTPAPASPASTAPEPSVTASAPASASPSAPAAVLPGESWLAFQTNGANGYGVYLLREDGTGLHHWPSGIVGGYEHPDWSPDGQRIMVNSIENDGTEDIWSADVDGSDVVRHVDCVAPCVWADEAAWSPDGARIAFQRLVVDDDVFRSTLEILDVATGDVAVILTMPGAQVVLAPRWAPDGQRIVVEAIELAEPSLEADLVGGGIGVVDLAAQAPTVDLIVPLTTFAQSPDWSPDGTEVIYAQPSAGDADLLDLHGIAPDGGGERRITDLAATGGSAIQPAFAPDGERIVFVLTRSGQEESVVALVDVDGSDLRPATPAGYRDGYHPRLRPTP